MSLRPHEQLASDSYWQIPDWQIAAELFSTTGSPAPEQLQQPLRTPANAGRFGGNIRTAPTGLGAVKTTFRTMEQAGYQVEDVAEGTVPDVRPGSLLRIVNDFRVVRTIPRPELLGKIPSATAFDNAAPALLEEPLYTGDSVMAAITSRHEHGSRHMYVERHVLYFAALPGVARLIGTTGFNVRRNTNQVSPNFYTPKAVGRISIAETTPAPYAEQTRHARLAQAQILRPSA